MTRRSRSRVVSCRAVPCRVHQDESTSALDVVLEREVMQKCIDNNITCLSVGHRPTLLHFHNVVMELDGHGSYNIKVRPVVVSRTHTLTGAAA